MESSKMAGGGGDDGGGSRLRSEAAVLVKDRWVDAGGKKASVEDISSNSIPSHSSTSPSPIDCSRKRKLMTSFKVADEKRHHETKSVFSDPHDSMSKSSSNLREDEITNLFKTANISSTGYEFLVPSKDQRANNPPEGYISVYSIQIDAGLRFPLHGLVVKVCNLIKVSPSQLVPDAHRMIVGFISCAKLYDIPLTADSFFSLFYVFKVGPPDNGFYQFAPRKYFLSDSPSSCHSWKGKFFFLRPKGKSWNCLTEWRETFSNTRFNAALAQLTVNKGILDHCFRLKELTCKKLLVHGGIEPGVPSPNITFRYLMHRAAVNKFELLPEDLPPAREITGEAKTPSTAPSAPNNSATSTAVTSSPAQPSAKQSDNHEQSLSSPSHTKIPSSTDMPIRKDLPASSEDSISLNDCFCKKKEGQATESTSPMSDETCPNSLPPLFFTIWQTIESAYVPRERYQKLEKDAQELTSELAFTKSRVQELEHELELSKVTKSLVQELEQELELSDAKRAESESMIFWAMEALKNLEKSVENLKSDSNRICDKIMKDAIEASSQMLSRRKQLLRKRL